MDCLFLKIGGHIYVSKDQHGTGTVTTPTTSSSGTSTMTGAPTGAGTVYWFGSHNVGEIESIIKHLLLTYKDLKNEIELLAEKMKQYVNVGGKWNDANSKIFAEWWNGGMTGSLVAKPGEGLQIEASGQSYTIKEILNRTANIYWITVCRQLYFVINMKYPQQLNSIGESTRQSYFKGSDESYSTAPINSENVWTNLMAELSGDTAFNWSKLNLKVENASNGGSSNSEIEAFIQAVSEKIHLIDTRLGEFLRWISWIINDTPTSNNCFGFTPNPNMMEASKYFENEKAEFITNFGTNVKNALSMYDESVNNKINEYLSTKYNLN